MDSPLLPGFLVLAGVVGIVLLGIVEHFIERAIEDSEPAPAEHEGWEGEHAAELTDTVRLHLVDRQHRHEESLRLRRDQLPGGDS